MDALRRFREALLIATAGIVGLSVSAAAASDMGQAAADEVSETSYRFFLGDNQGIEGILYTHAGDNRGFGAEHDLARDNIVETFESYGLTVTLEPFSYSGNTYYNVVATKLGTVFPEQEYIVGAHFDSVDNPGADDNASGTALVLEAARILSQYESDYTIRFIAFDREEQGLIGSEAYVEDHLSDDILGMISTDMVAYNTGADLAEIYGHNASSPIKEALAEAVITYGDGLSYSIFGQFDASDHAPFEWAGFEACLLIENWGNPYYHSPQDNVDMPGYIDYAYAVKMARSIVGFLVDAAGVDVPINVLEFTYPDGRPDFIDPAGGTRMQVQVSGVGDAVPQPGTGQFHYDLGGGWQTIPMEALSENLYEVAFPAADCPGEVLYYVSAESVDGEVFSDPRNAPADHYAAIAAYGRVVFYEDDFESDQGWAVSGDALDGMWERGIPAGGGDRGDPPTDHDGSGRCYVTDNADDNSDVDDGYTFLTSPTIDLSEGDAEVRYALWYTNFFGSNPNDDLFKTYVSDNNGADWVLVETIGPETFGGWVERAFSVGDFVTPNDQVRLMFEASDLGGGSVVEAGIDAVVVMAYECEAPCPGEPDGDMDGSGITNAEDLQPFVDALLGTPSPDDLCHGDFNGDGTLDTDDIPDMVAALLAA